MLVSIAPSHNHPHSLPPSLPPSLPLSLLSPQLGVLCRPVLLLPTASRGVTSCCSVGVCPPLCSSVALRGRPRGREGGREGTEGGGEGLRERMVGRDGLSLSRRLSLCCPLPCGAGHEGTAGDQVMRKARPIRSCARRDLIGTSPYSKVRADPPSLSLSLSLSLSIYLSLRPSVPPSLPSLPLE